MLSYEPVDPTRAVQLAPRVWWVGSLLPDDQFQCHVYLIEQGDRSVLIDPGSALVVDEVITKVDEVVGVANLRWLVCSHADPDIIGALPGLVAHGLHPDAAIVTHWRDEALIRHSGTRLPYWRVEEHGWRLPLEDRSLRFVFTPYAHFAGAFCSFDESSRTLFSADLFGGFSDDHSLFATSTDYFESMRAFHEHYMPSREIVVHALDQLRELPIERIAPQHGRIIPGHLIAPVMDQLAELECGIYLLARNDPGLAFLLEANRTVHDVVDTLVGEPTFTVIATHLAGLAHETLHTRSLEFWARAGETVLHFDDTDRFAGRTEDPPADVRRALDGRPSEPGTRLMVALASPTSDRVDAVAVLTFEEVTDLDEPSRTVLQQIADLVEVGLEREVLRRVADLDRAALYEQSIRDPLTGLHNRLYLGDAANRVCAIDDRGARPQVAALMIDLDHFKRVNDTHGHPTGDLVLQHVAAAVGRSVRPGDIAVRFGGEEFLVIVSGVEEAGAVRVAERIRAGIARAVPGQPGVTASVGVALRQRGQTWDSLVDRADHALYAAKDAGRDQVTVAR